MKIFIYGYGNPGRQDDALGILFVDKFKNWVEKNKIKNVYFDSNYQLNLEDSLEITKYDLIIFVDASKTIKKNFSFIKIKPKKKLSYTTHNMLPENILYLCKELYNKSPDAYLLTIKGYKWEINNKQTKKALKNLKNALFFIKKIIKIFTYIKKVKTNKRRY